MKERQRSPSLKLLGKVIRRFERENAPEIMQESPIPVVSASGMELGLKLVFSVVLGAGFGVLLDKWLGLSPWLMVAGLLWGATVGFIRVIHSSDDPGRSRKN